MQRKQKSLRSDPSLWGIGIAYVAGMVVLVLMAHMIGLGATSFKFKGKYNKSSAAEFGTNSRESFGGTTDNLLQNGSFELPIIRAQSQLVTDNDLNFSWRVSWVNDNPRLKRLTRQPALELLAGYLDWQPHAGSQFARLDGANVAVRAAQGQSLTRVSQRVVVEPNQNYTLTFWFAAQPGSSAQENQLSVNWNGRVLGQVSADGTTTKTPQWKQYTYQIESANSSSGELSFVGGGTENGVGILLDDVVLQGPRNQVDFGIDTKVLPRAKVGVPYNDLIHFHYITSGTNYAINGKATGFPKGMGPTENLGMLPGIEGSGGKASYPIVGVPTEPGRYLIYLTLDDQYGHQTTGTVSLVVDR